MSARTVARTVTLDCEDHYASDWARHEPRGQGGAAEPYRVIGARGTASPDRLGRFLLDARPRCTAPPPAHLHCLPPPPPAPLPPAPCPTHLHAHFSSRTHHESAAAPSCLFGSSRTLAFIRVPQARLALKLCWPDSFRYATGGARTFARHSTNRSARHSANTCPPQRRAYALTAPATAHTCLDHAPCWAHWALGAREMTWAIHAPLRSWARSSVGGTLESFVGPSCR